MDPPKPPFPTAMNRPFHVVVGSQSSALIFESEVGVSRSRTRQYSGSGGGPGGGGPIGAARPVPFPGAPVGTPRPPRPVGGSCGVTTSAAAMVTFGIAADRRLSQFEVAAAEGVMTFRKGPMTPMRALSFRFMDGALPA